MHGGAILADQDVQGVTGCYAQRKLNQGAGTHPPPLLSCWCHAVKFTSGAPLRPFEQLLAVLPAASASLLPPVFQQLMLDPHSPIIDFYPTDFAVDMEGKRASWEGVVKIPFVEEVRAVELLWGLLMPRMDRQDAAGCCGLEFRQIGACAVHARGNMMRNPSPLSTCACCRSGCWGAPARSQSSS